MPFRHGHSYSPIMPFNRLPSSSSPIPCSGQQSQQSSPQLLPIQRLLRVECGSSADAYALPGVLLPSAPFLFSPQSANAWRQSSYGSVGSRPPPPRPPPPPAVGSEPMAGYQAFSSDLRLLSATSLAASSSLSPLLQLPHALPALDTACSATGSQSRDSDSSRMQSFAASSAPFSYAEAAAAAYFPSPMSSSSSLSSVSGSSAPSSPAGGSSVSSSSPPWLPSPHSGLPDSPAGCQSESELWHCGLGCGQSYARTSGRSIRRHLQSCFRTRRAGGASLTDRQVDAAIAAAQASGQLSTGFKRWQKRRRRRLAEQLSPESRWDCARCGKMYRRTSTKSIRLHAQSCSGDRPEHDDSSSKASAQQTGTAAHDADAAMEEQQPEQLGLLLALPPASLRPSLTSGSSSSFPMSLPPSLSDPGDASANAAMLDNILRLYNQQLQITSELQRCVQSIVLRPHGDAVAGAAGAAAAHLAGHAKQLSIL